VLTNEVTKKELCDMGWILQKLEGGGSMVLERVKEYPTVRFDIGEERRRKADLVQVAGDMRKTRETVGGRGFETESEWLTKAQV